MQHSEGEGSGSLQKQLAEAKEKIHRYEKELTDLQAKVADLEKKLMDTSVMSRWKIGEYLHDSLAQKLNYAKILISFMKRDHSSVTEKLSDQCDEILELIDEGINEVRDLSHDIIPTTIGEEGIEHAFIYLKEQVESRHEIACELELGEVTQRDIDEQIVTNLYLIAQESIKNAITHGEADHVRVALFRHEGKLYMHVKDDGKGYSDSDKGGVGLDIMRYRAKEMGGSFRIRAAKKTEPFSTYVTCTLPLDVLN